MPVSGRMIIRALLGSLLMFAAGAAGAMECGERAADASRIAVAGGSLTEILYALDEADRIIAVDTTSNFPPAATELTQIGYVRNLSAEGLLSVKPTLVLGEHDMGPPAVLDQLDAVGVDLLRVPETFDAAGIATKVRCVAQAIGAEARGEALIAEHITGLDAPEDQPDQQPRGLVLLGLREGSPIAAGRETSGAGLLAMAGAANVLDDFEGWKPVSRESLAAASPDFIAIPERGLNSAGGIDALLEHPALRLTPAARNERVIAMDGMAMLGFGLRTLDTAHRLREAMLNGQDQP